MKPVVLIRVLVASLVGVLAAWFVDHDYEKWHALGREAFLVEQAHRFDTRMDPPSTSSVVASGICGVLFVAVYEGVVAAITKLTSRAGPR